MVAEDLLCGGKSLSQLGSKVKATRRWETGTADRNLTVIGR